MNQRPSLSRALQHAFTDLGREHVISLIHPENIASVAVARRIGETYERTIEFFGDRVHVYGIGREDWTAG